MADTQAKALPTDSEYPWWINSAPPWAQPYLLLARLDRPIGTWLLLLPCWWGAALGAIAMNTHTGTLIGTGTGTGTATGIGTGLPNLWHLALFAAGALIMRSAGCAFNDIVDKNIDAQVARTRARPVASGQLSRSRAFVFTCALSLTGLVILLQFNALTIGLGAASLALVAAYPFMKRITWWPQAWLGLTFNWGALLGYTAATGTLDLPAILLYSAGVLWTLGYDTIYACQDIEDDALIGVRSTARLFAANVRLWVGRFFSLSLIALIASLMTAGSNAALAILLCSPVALLFGRQCQALKTSDPDYLQLFREHRSIGILIFAVFCISA